MSKDKPWLKNYPEGTPSELEFDPKTLVTLLDEAESKFPEVPAFTNFGVSITTKEVEIKSKQFAAYLQKDLGLKKGDYPVTDAHTHKIITFPCDQHLSQKEMNFVIQTVTDFYQKTP